MDDLSQVASQSVAKEGLSFLPILHLCYLLDSEIVLAVIRRSPPKKNK